MAIPLRFTDSRKIIPMLTDPAPYGGRTEDAFDVVIPDLPGYGFSDRSPEAERIFRELLAEDIRTRFSPVSWD